MRGSFTRNPAIGAAWLSLLLVACGGNKNDRAAEETADATRPGAPADTFGAGGRDTSAYTGSGTDTTTGAVSSGTRDTAATTTGTTPTRPRRTSDPASPAWSQPVDRARRSTRDSAQSWGQQADSTTTAWGQQADSTASSWSARAQDTANRWSQGDTSGLSQRADGKLTDTTGWNSRNQGDTAAFAPQDTTQGGQATTWGQQNQADTTGAGQRAMQQDSTGYGQQSAAADSTAWNRPGQDSSMAQRSSLTNQTTIDTTRASQADSVPVSGGVGNQNAMAAQDTLGGMGAGGVAGLTADSLRKLGWIRASECSCQGQSGMTDTTRSGWRGSDSTAWGNQSGQSRDSSQQSSQGYQPSSGQASRWSDTSRSSTSSSWADTARSSTSANSWGSTAASGQDTSAGSGWSQDTTRRAASQDTARNGLGALGPDSSLGGLDPMTLTNANLAYLLDEANVADSTAGALAYSKATDDEVKRYARMMETEHGALRKDARAHLQRVQVNPEAPPTDPVKQMADNGTRTLEATPRGRQFDQAYIDHEVQMHQALLNLLRQARSSSRGQALIEPILEKAEPVLQKHLERAQELQRQVGRPGTADGAAAPDSSGSR
ncbi:MAG: DUF4142 domain-containing protein [Gemmatimonadetes bacterium]|nr:DUF4142 domain-containing protein [Gemmatimonadota bacterium]